VERGVRGLGSVARWCREPGLARITGGTEPRRRRGIMTMRIRGTQAIEAAKAGARLYVLSPQHGWIPVDSAATLARAAKMDPASLWIYAAEGAR